ncbi:hypothetical protein EV182_000704 [Spiromyces aspiralis]|uniref:Uncharacterized protein n=1 Tax=Spiromyces aspiralis TaxID=68401 RepID=A0ACC1HH97_9FUNG|nr:hypothetical protein EV182_000704 [Spiromyces aspiralis]
MSYDPMPLDDPGAMRASSSGSHTAPATPISTTASALPSSVSPAAVVVPPLADFDEGVNLDYFAPPTGPLSSPPYTATPLYRCPQDDECPSGTNSAIQVSFNEAMTGIPSFIPYTAPIAQPEAAPVCGDRVGHNDKSPMPSVATLQYLVSDLPVHHSVSASNLFSTSTLPLHQLLSPAIPSSGDSSSPNTDANLGCGINSDGSSMLQSPSLFQQIHLPELRLPNIPTTPSSLMVATIPAYQEYDPENPTVNLDCDLRRPPNAFILYRAFKHRELLAQNIKMTAKVTSKFLADKWKKEPEDVRNRFFKQAREQTNRYKLQKKINKAAQQRARRARKRALPQAIRVPDTTLVAELQELVYTPADCKHPAGRYNASIALSSSLASSTISSCATTPNIVARDSSTRPTANTLMTVTPVDYGSTGSFFSSMLPYLGQERPSFHISAAPSVSSASLTEAVAAASTPNNFETSPMAGTWPLQQQPQLVPFLPQIRSPGNNQHASDHRQATNSPIANSLQPLIFNART